MGMSFEYYKYSSGSQYDIQGQHIFEEHWLGSDSTLLSSVWNLIDFKFIDH